MLLSAFLAPVGGGIRWRAEGTGKDEVERETDE